MQLTNTKNLTSEQLTQFFTTHWGSPEMVISSGIYDCSALDGFAMLNEATEIIGLITYIIREKECEIISLNSIQEGKGIGTLLIQAVETAAQESNCRHVKLITTNDNLYALKFYQKRGYCLTKLHRNAVEQARERKPSIPYIGNDGIPIRDELELEKVLS